MHSDIIEAFVIFENTPIIVLGHDNPEELQLRASRITVQDVVGSEATGENIEMELLEESYFIYQRLGGFLGVLHCKKSMNPYGARRLLEKVLERVNEEKNLILEHFGSQYHLRHVIRDINLILGEYIPTTPQGLAMSENLIGEFFRKQSSVVAIGLLTPEAWPIIIRYNKDEAIPLPEFFWSEIAGVTQLSTETIYQVELTSDDSFYLIRRIKIPPENEKNFWLLVIKALVAKDEDWFSLRNQLVKATDEALLPQLQKTVYEMVAQEIEFMGMEGILGNAIRSVFLGAEKIIWANSLYQSPINYFGFLVKGGSMVNLNDVLNGIMSFVKGEGSQEGFILPFPFTIFITFDEATRRKIFEFGDQIAILLAQQGLFEDYSEGRPLPLQHGIGNTIDLIENNDYFISLLEKGVPVELHFERVPNTVSPPTSSGVHEYSAKQHLGDYRFSLFRTKTFSWGILVFKGRRYWRGIWTTERQIVEIIENRLQALKFIEESEDTD